MLPDHVKIQHHLSSSSQAFARSPWTKIGSTSASGIALFLTIRINLTQHMTCFSIILLFPKLSCHDCFKIKQITPFKHAPATTLRLREVVKMLMMSMMMTSCAQMESICVVQQHSRTTNTKLRKFCWSQYTSIWIAFAYTSFPSTLSLIMYANELHPLLE